MSEQILASLYRFNYLVGHDDTDDSGVMHFARYAGLIETAVLAGLGNVNAGLAAIRDEGLDLVVTELRVKYEASAKFLDNLQIAARTKHVGIAQFRMAGTVQRESEQSCAPTLLATGELVMGAVDPVNRTASALPPRVRTALLSTK